MIPHHAVHIGGDWALIAPDEFLKTALQTPGGAYNKIAIGRRTKTQRIEGCRCIHDAKVLRLRDKGCFKMVFGLWSLVFGLWSLVFGLWLWTWLWALGFGLQRGSWQRVNC